MRSKTVLATCLFPAALSVAACSSTTGGFTTDRTPTGTIPAVAAPPPPSLGVLGGAIGESLDEKDRAAAIAAQQDAVSSGERKSWRGAHGAYGFIAPGPEAGACRDYTHKVFINGRPQEAKGQACLENGEWRVTS